MRFASLVRAAAVATLFLSAVVLAQEVKVTLAGNQEIPPVTTTGSGSATITVAPDLGVTGRIVVTGMTPTVAHIHLGPPGANGPIVVPLTKTGDNVWSVPPGARLTVEQYDAFKSGNLYYNVHSEAHRGGEIRGQIRP
jgi:hypothetical protein